MKNFIRFGLIVFFAAPLFQTGRNAPTPSTAWLHKVDVRVWQSAAQGETEILVFMDAQADLGAAEELETKNEKVAYVYKQLTSVAERTQGNILKQMKASGIEHRSFWIANMIWARGSMEDIAALAQRKDVGSIHANPNIRNDLPRRTLLPETAPLPRSTAVIEWNIDRVGAPHAWESGITGQGTVIGGQDTGYDWDHPALINSYRGWDGSSADHNYHWHDAIHAGGGICGPDSPEPCDDYGHGTHTMGTMVGDDGAGNQIGMAPGARWIGCRNMDRGYGTPATYTECFQWFLAPTDLNDENPNPSLAADVINNSWYCPPEEGCSWETLQTVVDNVRAAGIVVVVSAGNSGSQGCGSVNYPPAIYDSAFSVGATDYNENIASFSSRGPSDYTNLRKPDVSAPGMEIRSSTPGGGYGIMSGTSMAAPHVSGLVGLLLSTFPYLSGQVDEIENLIELNAVPRTSLETCGGIPGSQVPNNTFGWGRVEVLLSVHYFPYVSSSAILPLKR